jgi:EXPERA (EXPanded EBP superfamily)
VVDLGSLYPPSIRPHLIEDIRLWYVREKGDLFFDLENGNRPAWFGWYVYMELLLHMPLSFYAIGALWRHDRRVEPALLVYAVQTFVTTLTCIAQMLSWDVSADTKTGLLALYGPYLAVSVVMGGDMFFRLLAVIGERTGQKVKKRV